MKSDDVAHKVHSQDGVHTISFEVAGKSMSFETGRIGRQAGGAVFAKTMDTIVYSTVCNEREATPVDFTPLKVDFFARFSAVGQTVGAFHRRDSRGDDNEILVARLIDRPIRPMIKDGWQHDTQVLAWVLSYDKINSPDALAICAASAAMSISEVPMLKPVAGVEVGLVDGKFIINPTNLEMEASTLKLTLAGTKSAILMIEGLADFLPEEVMVEALRLGHEAIGTICDKIEIFQGIAGVPKKLDTLRILPDSLLDSMDQLFGVQLQQALSIGDKNLRGKSVAQVEETIIQRFVRDIAPIKKDVRGGLLDGVLTTKSNDAESNFGADSIDSGAPLVDTVENDDIIYPGEMEATLNDSTDASLEEDEASELIGKKANILPAVEKQDIGYGYDGIDVKIALKKLLVRRLRGMILQTGRRSDGRSVEQVRPIGIDTSLLPGAHGSALFTRGETQAIATATLGSKAMEAKFETLDTYGTKRFYLQYRFPPSSVGEVGRVGGVNRREVGHGNLAERALQPCIPDASSFPYAIRAESLITESSGSSSMATVCGCCLAMLDAGVPLKTSVAGVAMGLILGEKEGDEPVILTDILGLEDALGTMDFKVAGNETGITTFQLDIKCDGLTLPVLERSLMQAKQGRLEILSKMKAALSEPRPMKDTIPKIFELSVPIDALGKIIGPKGKTVQTLIETHKLININLEDDGTVQIEAFTFEAIESAKEAIMKLVAEAAAGMAKKGKGRDGSDSQPAEPVGPPPEPGMIYRDCEVTGVQKFGVFVMVLPGHEGLVHVSELDVKKVSTTPEEAGYKIGQKMDVKCIGLNDKGQLRFSRRQVLLRDTPSPSSVSSSVTESLLHSASADGTRTTSGNDVKPYIKKSITAAAEDAYN